jgi:copper(I)-binding protein
VIRTLCLLGWAALVAVGLTRFTTVERVSSTVGTPATLLPDADDIEIADAIPVSLVIRNDSGAEDRLLGGSSPVALRVEVHRTRLVQGRREMHPFADGLTIPANETLILEPGASHLMLLGLQASLVQGQTFPLTLRFAHAGEVTVPVRVRRRVDAAGLTPFPPSRIGDLSVSLASAPPAPPGTLVPEPDREPD